MIKEAIATILIIRDNENMYEIKVEKVKDLRFTSSDYRYVRFQKLIDKLPMQKIALKAELKYINRQIKGKKI